MKRILAVILEGLLRFAGMLMIASALVACQSFPSDPSSTERVPLASDKFILESPDDEVIGHVQVITARYEDTLPDIARRFNLGFDEIVAANPGVDPWLPGEGTRVVLPTQFVLPAAPREGIVLNLAALRLFYFPKTGPNEPQVVITHPIGIGRVGWSTPLGMTRVVKKEKAPTWYVPESIRREHAEKGDPLPAAVPPGPDNPLGTHVLRLTLPSYLIHGTNKPYGIGMRVSHGCIQLYPEDILSLFEKVPVGTPVRIVNQPFLAGWKGEMLYLEIHEPLEDDKRKQGKVLVSVLKAKGSQGQQEAFIDWEKVRRLATSPRGLPIPVLLGSPSQDEVLAAARWIENVPPLGLDDSRKVGGASDRKAPRRQAEAGSRNGRES